MRQPNILWICADQQRFDTLGCYGNPFVHTPNLDRLAETGTLFENAFSQAPVCTPSRASFLTGRYPRTTRCRQNGQNVPEDEVLVTKILADAGYTCGLSGKLHLSACHPRVTISERRINDGYHEFHWSHDPDNSWPANEYIRWLHAKGKEYSPKNLDECSYVQIGPNAEDHQTTWCAQKAIEFIEEMSNYDKPWLFSVNIFDPHHPFNPPEEYLQRYLKRIDEIPLPNYTHGELNNKPYFQNFDRRGAYGSKGLFPFSNMTDKDHRYVKAAYWAMVDLIDAQVGRMIDSLERTGQRDNTIVIFMADHGELLGDHGVYLKGPYFYEPCVHVPLILSCPGKILQGKRVSKLTELIDLAPTLLDAAGLPRYPGMQSQSFLPLLTGCGEDIYNRNDIYCEHYNASWKQAGIGGFATMVRTTSHKLIVYHKRGEGELYNLKDDPTETHNLWNDPQNRDIKLEMVERLCDRMAETVDPLPERLDVW